MTQEAPVEEVGSTPADSVTPENSEVQETGDVAAASPEDIKKRRDRRAERRIAKLTARNAKLEEQLESQRKRYEKIEERLDTIAQPNARPQRENYETEEEYEDALVDYRLDMRSQPTKSEEPRLGAVDQALVDKFQGFIEEVDKGTPGFADMVSKAHFPLTDHGLAEIIEMGDDGADVFTHLNQNPAEAMRISRLTPREQTVELEKIADTVDMKTSAPDPITPVSGNDQPVVDESKLSTDDWIARRNRKVFGR